MFLLGPYQDVGEPVAILFAGVGSGIVMAIFASFALHRRGKVVTFILAIVLLPVGLFIFGYFISSLHLIIDYVSDIQYRFARTGYGPLDTASGIAWFSVSPYALLRYLLPLGLATTYIFVWHMKRSPKLKLIKVPVESVDADIRDIEANPGN